jgi:hypothetical protein
LFESELEAFWEMTMREVKEEKTESQRNCHNLFLFCFVLIELSEELVEHCMLFLAA